MSVSSLLAEVCAEAIAKGRRRIEARAVSGKTVLAVDRDVPAPISGTGPRFASSNEPCPRCATRGDIGCKHQSPFGSYMA